jgi:hypothetical protein
VEFTSELQSFRSEFSIWLVINWFSFAPQGSLPVQNGSGQPSSKTEKQCFNVYHIIYSKFSQWNLHQSCNRLDQSFLWILLKSQSASKAIVNQPAKQKSISHGRRLWEHPNAAGCGHSPLGSKCQQTNQKARGSQRSLRDKTHEGRRRQMHFGRASAGKGRRARTGKGRIFQQKARSIVSGRAVSPSLLGIMVLWLPARLRTTGQQEEATSLVQCRSQLSPDLERAAALCRQLFYRLDVPSLLMEWQVRHRLDARTVPEAAAIRWGRQTA